MEYKSTYIGRDADRYLNNLLLLQFSNQVISSVSCGIGCYPGGPSARVPG